MDLWRVRMKYAQGRCMRIDEVKSQKETGLRESYPDQIEEARKDDCDHFDDLLREIKNP